MEPTDHSLHTNTLEPSDPIRPTNPFLKWKSEATASTIPRYFQQQARIHADRTAVKVGNDTITYKTLDKAANRVAQAILARHGKANHAVALLLGSDAQMFEAMLGALKAGKFYVPLDPSYPIERNRYIADDVSADLIITNNANLHLASGLVQAESEILNLDDLETGLTDEDPDLSTSPDDIAFIHYTSGSTGQPKGVIYTHRNVLHIALRFTNGQHISADDRLLLLSSYSYGASVGNIFGGLLNGAAICVFDIVRQGLDKLVRFLIEEDISIYYSVTTVFRHFAGALTGDEQFPRLRLIRLGGEAVYRGDVELYQKRFRKGCLLHVGYGTTETNLAREYFFDTRLRCDTEVAPVGYAVDDVEVLVLDEKGEPLGFDAIGEISVRSRYISPGYWRRPELTGKVFREDPENTSVRIYRTGDLGRMLPDGCLIHIGREDSQVKVRGFRIEALEVEAALLNIDEVTEVAVIAREGNNAEKRLSAYVVLEKGSKLNPAELRAALRRSLPDFMIPTSFRILDELPRTPVGKVDQNRLHKLPLHRQGDFVAPREPVEARLKEIWEQILDVRPVGITDDFFNLGGDSLAASELFTDIEAIYGKQFPASALLEHSTIEQVATLIMKTDGEHSSLVPIQTAGTCPPFFCVHGIGGDVISFRSLSNFLGGDQPLYGLRAGAGGANRTSVEEIAAYYIVEMQHLQPQGPYHLGGYSFGGTIAFEMARQLVAKGKTVGLLAMFDTYGPGYPKLLAVNERAAIHWKAILRAEPSKKLSYLRERIAVNATRIKKSARRLSKRAGSHANRNISPKTDNLEATHQRALWDYVPKPYDGRLDLFRAIDQKAIWEPDPLLGWTGFAVGGIRVHDIPGDHISIMMEPNVCVLADSLRQCLGRVNQETDSLVPG